MYKRQALSYPEGAYGTLTMDALRSQGIKLTFTTQPGVNAVVQGLPQTLYSMPVSYTHLDVYKRQPVAIVYAEGNRKQAEPLADCAPLISMDEGFAAPADANLLQSIRELSLIHI